MSSSRGQISLEYLILSVVALSLLMLSVFALTRINDYSFSSANALRFKSSADSLSSAISEVCALGDGNVRSVETSVPLSVHYSEGGIMFRTTDHSISRQALCEVNDAELEAGLISVENSRGMVSIREKN